MTQLMMTDEQQRLLDESRDIVEIVDRTGRLLTRVIGGFTESELDEAAVAAREFQSVGTLQSLLDRLKAGVAH